MKKILFLAVLLPFAACKKNITTSASGAATPDITETLSLSIVNLNPDKYDSARGHVSDTFSWSVPHAYGDTGIMLNGTFTLPPNSGTLIVESSPPFQTWLSVNNGPAFNTAGLTIGFPADTSYITLGYPIAGFSGGEVTWADTVATDRSYGIGLSRMLNWWRGDAIPVNDTVINNNVNLNTNELDLIVDDTLTFTSKGYIGDEFVVSGTFSELIWTEIGITYDGSYCRKYWYIKGTFSNLIYVFKPQ